MIRLLLILSLFLMGAASPKSEHTGKVIVYIFDYATHAEEKVKLHDGKQEIELRLPKDTKHRLKSGQRIKVRGLRTNDLLQIDGDTDVEILSIDPSPATSGPQKTAYFIPTYQNGAVATSPAHALAVATEIDNYYRQQSYGLLWHVGVKFPNQPADIIPIAIPVPSTDGCPASGVGSWVIIKAREAGWPVDDYRARVVLMPSSPCGYAGIAQVGANPFMAWANGEFNIRVIAHEMGHGYGLYHARREDCPGCGAAGEYSDHTDIMANSAGAFGGFERWLFGWLDRTGTPQTVTATQGTFTISALDAPADGLPKAVRVLRSGANHWYITYRSCTQYHNGYCGVYVHSGDTFTSSLLHAWTQYLGDWTLDIGDTFPDNPNSRFFSVLSVANGQAVIQVASSAPPVAVPVGLAIQFPPLGVK